METKEINKMIDTMKKRYNIDKEVNNIYNVLIDKGENEIANKFYKLYSEIKTFYYEEIVKILNS